MRLCHDEIKQILPQRAPILLLDEVLQMDAHSIEAVYTVPAELSVLAGHFPGAPVFPGVYTVEAMAQAADVLLLSQPEHRGKQPLFVGMDRVRFRQKILPGAKLRLTAELSGCSEQVQIYTFQTTCCDFATGALYASASLLLGPR